MSNRTQDSSSAEDDLDVIKNILSQYSERKVAAVCGKLVRALFTEWNVTDDELGILLGPDADIDALLSEPSLIPESVVRRLGILVGIDRATCALLPIRPRATAYLRRPNVAFNGESAMTVMLRGSIEDLHTVRRHLESWLV